MRLRMTALPTPTSPPTVRGRRSIQARRQRTRRLAAIVLSALLTSAWTPEAGAEQYFSLEWPDVVVESIVEYEDEDRITRGSEFEEKTWTFAEEAEISTRGWVYHPALMIFSLDLTPRFRHQTTDTTGSVAAREDDTIFFGYAFDTTIFQFKPYTLDLSSSRSRSEFDSALSPDSVTETALDRGQLRLRYEPLPTTFTVERRETDFEGFNTFTDTTLRANATSRHESDESDTRLEIEYSEQGRKSQFSSFDTQRTLANASNLYKFGDRVRLWSNARAIQTTSDTRDTINLSLSENLDWEIESNLKNNSRLVVSHHEDDEFFSRTVTGSNILTHRLYENLTTAFSTKASRKDFTNGSGNSYGGALDFSYRRRIPWGYVTLTNGYGAELEDDRTNAAFRDVRDESLSLQGTNLVFLSNEDIDVDTIVVTDLTGLIVFAEGVDYVVAQFGDSVAIQRAGVGSSIPDNSSVLVDYRFQSQGPVKFWTARTHVGGRLDLWNSLRLFYNRTNTEDRLISGTPSGELADDTIQRAGAELTWRWSRTEFEWEDRDTTRAPLTRIRFTEALSFQPWRQLSLGLGASYAETTLKETDDESREYGASATARWQPFRHGQFLVRAFSRQTRGDIQETDDIGLDARFRWRYGLWSGTLSYILEREEDLRDDQKRNRQLVLVTVKRKF